MGIDRQVADVFGAAIFEEVAGHPVIFAGTGQALDRLAEIAPVRLGATFAGGTDQPHVKALVEGNGDQRRLAVARHTLDADMALIHLRPGREIIEDPTGAPAPGPERAPVIRLARLALIDEADNALGQACAIIGLIAGRVEQDHAPAVGDQFRDAFDIGSLCGGEKAGHARVQILRRRRRHTRGRKLDRSPGEHDQNRRWPLGLCWQDHHGVDIDRNGRVRRIIDVTGQMRSYNRCITQGFRIAFGHPPCHRRHIGRYMAYDLALEGLGNFRPPLLPPLLGRSDFLTIVQGQDIGPVGVGIGQDFVIIGAIRSLFVAAWAGPQGLDFKLVHHVLMVLFRGEALGGRDCR